MKVLRLLLWTLELSKHIKIFAKRNCDITVFPATTKPEEILGINPDLIFLSNGPGDPEDLEDVIENIKELIGKNL